MPSRAAAAGESRVERPGRLPTALPGSCRRPVDAAASPLVPLLLFLVSETVNPRFPTAQRRQKRTDFTVCTRLWLSFPVAGGCGHVVRLLSVCV